MQPEDKVPVANSLIVFREEFDDWAILFDPDTGKAFGINPVAALIWKRLDGNHSVRSIQGDIRRKFESVPGDLDAHIDEFLRALVNIGFAGYKV
jgi:SynChlorMet cassette protein ScmD